MKGEYINLFTAFANTTTNEVVIVLKQESANPNFVVDESGERQIKMSVESIDMYKAILSIDNAKQLAEVLFKCIEQTEKSQENHKK